MENNGLICPICGAERKNENSYECANCGFSTAYVSIFAGQKSYESWLAACEEQRLGYLKAAFIKQREEGGSLQVCGNCAVLHDSGLKKCLSVDFILGYLSTKENVKQVSISGLTRVYLMNDDTLECSGDNYYGQCDLKGFKGVSSVLATAECTYVSLKNKIIDACGATPYGNQLEKVFGKNVKSISCGAKHIAFLYEDGTVQQLEQAIGTPLNAQSKAWEDVVSVAAGAGYTIALTNDGKVLYAGPDDEKKDVALWEDIVAIAADNQYAVGLTRSGDVLLAGKNVNQTIDFGRSEAAKWKNVCYVATGQSGIAALTYDGKLLTTSAIQPNNVAYTSDFEKAVVEMVLNKRR